jgi:hypothetical protein
MADSNVDIYTLQCKRVACALQNLVDGLAQIAMFNAEHTIDSKLATATNVTVGFEEADYDVLVSISKGIDDLVTANASWIKKFGDWDQSKDINDPLDILGKIFYQFGTPIREKI